MATKYKDIAPFLTGFFEQKEHATTEIVVTKAGPLSIDKPDEVIKVLMRMDNKHASVLEVMYERYKSRGLNEIRAFAKAVDSMIIPESDGILVYKLAGHWQFIKQGT